MSLSQYHHNLQPGQTWRWRNPGDRTEHTRTVIAVETYYVWYRLDGEDGVRRAPIPEFVGACELERGTVVEVAR